MCVWYYAYLLYLLAGVRSRGSQYFVTFWHVSLHSFSPSHSLAFLYRYVCTCMPCVCASVCIMYVYMCVYILIYMYTYIYMCVYIYIFSFVPSSLFICETIFLHICVNVQLNNRRQWLDRMAFDDVFSNFLFFGCSRGVSSRLGMAHYIPPLFCSYLSW